MNDNLPKGWTSASLSQLGTWLGGGTPSKAARDYWENGTVHWVSPKDMKRLLIDSAQDQITAKAVLESATNLVPANSVLMVTRSGILKHSFPVAVNTIDVAINQDLKAWTPSTGAEPMYLAYFLRSRTQDILASCSKDGTTVSSIDFDRLASYEIALAPRPEQLRIVSKIDELFSRIDEGERALEQVQKLVERFRQSVLKAAVTGELTHEWRKRHASQCEPDSPVSECQQALPTGWRMLPLSEIVIDGPKNGYSPKADVGAEGTWSLKLTATTSGKLRLDDDAVKRVNEVVVPESPLWLEPGDVLIQRANSLEHVGATAIFNGPPRSYIYPDLMMRIRVADPVLRQWVWRYLNGETARQFFRSRATGTAGSMPKINATTVKSLPVPVPPPEELAVVLSRLEQLLSEADIRDTEVKQQLQQSASLRQATLREAFRGALLASEAA